jgi:hypothetical protein
MRLIHEFLGHACLGPWLIDTWVPGTSMSWALAEWVDTWSRDVCINLRTQLGCISCCVFSRIPFTGMTTWCLSISRDRTTRESSSLSFTATNFLWAGIDLKAYDSLDRWAGLSEIIPNNYNLRFLVCSMIILWFFYEKENGYFSN